MGLWNWPSPEPALPKLLSGTNSAWAVVAPSASIKAQAASAPLAPRTGPKRSRHLLAVTTCVLLAIGSKTRDGLIESSSVRYATGRLTCQSDWPYAKLTCQFALKSRPRRCVNEGIDENLIANDDGVYANTNV